MRTVTRREFLRQAADHLPLTGRGILRLVHEDMVDPAIQPEQHPLRHQRIGQQTPGPGDQIVEVEHPARELARLVGGNKDRGEAVKGEGAVKGLQAQPVVPGVFDPLHQRLDPLHQVRFGRPQRLGGKASDLGAMGLLGGFAEQKHLFEQGQGSQRRRPDRKRPTDPRGSLGIVRPALRTKRRQIDQRLMVFLVENPVHQDLDAQPRSKPEGRAQCGLVHGTKEQIPPGRDIGKKLVESLAREMAGKPVDARSLGSEGKVVHHLATQDLGRAILDLGKAGG
jgi:hypothetical protein